MVELIQQQFQKRDWQSAVLLAAIVGAVVMILLPTISPSAQRNAVERFHLANDDFSSWAIQQPLPSMYNFENRYWVSSTPLSKSQLELGFEEARSEGIKTTFANHYPTRVFTFGDARKFHLEKKAARFLYLKSRFRGVEVESMMEVTGDPENGFSVKRNSAEGLGELF